MRNILTSWPPTPSTLAETLGTPQLAAWQAAATLLLASGTLVVLLSTWPRWAQPFALGTAAGILAVPIAVQGFIYLSDRHYFPVVTSRYGLVMLPAATLMLAVGVRLRHRTAAAVATGVFGSICLVTSLLAYG